MKPGFVQSTLFLLTPNHGNINILRALIIQHQSLLKEINTHGSEKNFLCDHSVYVAVGNQKGAEEQAENRDLSICAGAPHLQRWFSSV